MEGTTTTRRSLPPSICVDSVRQADRHARPRSRTVCWPSATILKLRSSTCSGCGATIWTSSSRLSRGIGLPGQCRHAGAAGRFSRMFLASHIGSENGHALVARLERPAERIGHRKDDNVGMIDGRDGAFSPHGDAFEHLLANVARNSETARQASDAPTNQRIELRLAPVQSDGVPFRTSVVKLPRTEVVTASSTSPKLILSCRRLNTRRRMAGSPAHLFAMPGLAVPLTPHGAAMAAGRRQDIKRRTTLRHGRSHCGRRMRAESRQGT